MRLILAVICSTVVEFVDGRNIFHHIYYTSEVSLSSILKTLRVCAMSVSLVSVSLSTGVIFWTIAARIGNAWVVEHIFLVLLYLRSSTLSNHKLTPKWCIHYIINYKPWLSWCHNYIAITYRLGGQRLFIKFWEDVPGNSWQWLFGFLFCAPRWKKSLFLRSLLEEILATSVMTYCYRMSCVVAYFLTSKLHYKWLSTKTICTSDSSAKFWHKNKHIDVVISLIESVSASYMPRETYFRRYLLVIFGVGTVH